MNTSILEFLVKQSTLSEEKIQDLYHRASSAYKIYDIHQGKRGKKRTIEAPDDDLKKIQKALILLFEQYPLHQCCTSVRGSSAVANAERHVGARYILKVDIKSCYPSITQSIIYNGLSAAVQSMETPMEDLIDALNFCLISKPKLDEPILPTGAPTSPILCNIALTPLDLEISNMLYNDYGTKYVYSRYLDDMIISTANRKRDWNIKNKVEKIIVQHNLKVNFKKSRWMDARDDDMVVTGIHVFSSRTGVPRVFWRNIRSRLEHIARENREIDAETAGCLAYIKSVDLKRYNYLLSNFEKRQHYTPPV